MNIPEQHFMQAEQHLELEFTYNETRVCNKLCLFAKTIGFVFYTSGACICMTQPKQNTLLSPYCIMLIGMFASNCNSVRYEYAFHKKCGTVFRSIHDFNAWKTKQLPKLSYGIDVIEMLIKLYFFIAAWPLKFIIIDDENHKFSFCELSMTVFKMHIVILFIIYLIVAFFVMCLYLILEINIMMRIKTTNTTNTTDTTDTTDATECCICLNRTEKSWTTTRCAHTFHRDCLSTWSQINATCPICRTNLSPLPMNALHPSI